MKHYRLAMYHPGADGAQAPRDIPGTLRRTILPVAAAVIAAALISGIWYSPMLFRGTWVSLRSEWLHVSSRRAYRRMETAGRDRS